MKSIALNSVEECLRAHISDKNAVFVFATDVSARSWADWCVVNGLTKAVAMDRFMAWDKFKESFLRATQEGKSSVPSLLRKFFIHNFISENAAKPLDDSTKLKKVIPPEFAGNASSFADWLAKILPSLCLWNNRMNEYKDSYGAMDEEDRDYKILFDAYNSFLEKNDMFEPSWITDVDFGNSRNVFYILYPEQLEDFEDFKGSFRNADNVIACTMPCDIPSPAVYNFPDARSELRQTMLRIIDICSRQKKADWSEVALSVPDIETYRPYLEREFDLYGIPYVIRAGISLTKNSAGKIFKLFSECYKSDFSYDSVRTLLLDECIPWAKEVILPFKMNDKTDAVEVKVALPQAKESLIREGNILRCICSYEEKNESGEYEKKDSWLQGLYSRYGSDSAKLQAAEDRGDAESVKACKKALDCDIQNIALYKALKNRIKAFYEPRAKDNERKKPSFETVLSAWFSFKSTFIDEEDFSTDANQLLSRCIIHLQEMIEVEKNHCRTNGLSITSPFDFFINELEGKSYTPQMKNKSGVSIFPYRLSAGAFFKYQFVIGASQKAIEVPFRRLMFLNSTKRAKLNLIEEDNNLRSTEVFAKLYAKKVDGIEDTVHFSSATDSFGGFSIPHSCLTEQTPLPNLDSTDYILEEKKWISGSSSSPSLFTKGQTNNLLQWKETAEETNQDESLNDALKEKIAYRLVEAKNAGIESGIKEYESLLAAKDDEQKNKVPAANVRDFMAEESNLMSEILSSFKDKPKISSQSEMSLFFPCPRKWVLSQLLSIKDDSLDTNLMKIYDMGNLNHSVLEFFMRQYLGRRLPYYDKERKKFFKFDGNGNTAEADDEIWNMISEDKNGFVEKAIFTGKKDFTKSPLAKKILHSQKEEIAEDIISFLKMLLIPYASDVDKNGKPKNISGIGGCLVYGVETKLVSHTGNAVVYGKIDCLLKPAEESDGWIIIDYKNTQSAMPGNKDIFKDAANQLGDFQMPMYCTLVTDKNLSQEISAAYFYAIRDCDKRCAVDEFIESDKSDLTQDSYNDTLEQFKKYAELFVEKTADAVEKGDADFAPHAYEDWENPQNVRTFKNCSGCQYSEICRTRFTVAQRQITEIRG